MLNERSELLSPQHKRILSIALLALICLAAAYTIFRMCCFKGEVKEEPKDEVPFYDPKNLKHDPPLNPERKKTHLDTIISLKTDLNTCAPIYEIPIHPLENELPTSNFRIVNYNIRDRTIEFLVEYGSTKNPEIQAFLDKEKNRLYIVGGRQDPSVEIAPGHFKIADDHYAWVRIDLNTLPQKDCIEIYGRLAGLYVWESSGKDKKVKDSSDEWLFTL